MLLIPLDPRAPPPLHIYHTHCEQNLSNKNLPIPKLKPRNPNPSTNLHQSSMASVSLLLLLLLAASTFSPAAAHRFNSGLDRGRMVGRWMEIPDAKSNKEVRELGLYSVNEYNRGLRGVAENLLAFSGVVSAGRQVVSGIRYRIRISAIDTGTGHPGFFDAVVVVRPWLCERVRDLVSFRPSAE